MKKIIVALMCVAHVTCFAMNEKNDKTRFRDIPRLLNNLTQTQALSVESQTLSGVAVWHQVEAMQVIAHSNRLQACIAVEEYNKKHSPSQYKKLNCQDIYEQYLALEKNSDQS